MRNLTPIRQRMLPLLILFLLLITAVSTAAQVDDHTTLPPPDSVTIAGTVQPAIGCSGEWNTTCADSQLTYDAANDLWWATFDIPAGDYEYKAALNGTWDDNYGLNAEYYGENIPLSVPEDGPVTFWYDHKTRWVSDSINSIIANVPGSFQDELGCAEDWMPACLRTLLQDSDGDGLYAFITTAIPAGEYEAKVAVDQAWTENYGADGALDGANIPFTVAEGQAVIFTFDPASKAITVTTSDEAPAGLVTDLAPAAEGGTLPPPAAPMPDLVVVPGTIQSVAGCAGDWEPDCEATALLFDETAQLWSGTFEIPAGEYEYKVALNGAWEVNFGQNAEPGGANIPLVVDEDGPVTFYFDHNTGWIADDVNNLIANVPGSFQSELGCAEDWMPACLRTWLQDPDGDGNFVFRTLDIPAGEYEAKVAVNLDWTVNYGEGGAQDGANIPFSVPEDDTLVTFTFDSRSNVLSIAVGAGAGPQGNIRQLSAYWVAADTFVWNIEHTEGNEYFFHYDPAGNALSLSAEGVNGTAVPLTVDPTGLPDELAAKFPHLANFTMLKVADGETRFARVALKGQTAISAVGADGALLNAAGLQTPGVIDDLYPYDGPLGVTIADGVPTITLWAPTARAVRLHLFDDSNPDSAAAEINAMQVNPRAGTWTITGEPDWLGKFYLFELEVYVPSEGSVQTNIVTDPYSFSLAANSTRSQIVDLSDPALMPEGWLETAKPALNAPEDIILYELHVRDFSVNDASVPEAVRGTFMAFTVDDSNGMTHLRGLSDAGLTHVHLLPVFDIATINENKAEWAGPTFAELAAFPPDAEEQQALIEATRDQDGFNWGV